MGFNQQSLGQYSQRFDNQLSSYKSGPTQNRSCNDIICVLIFLALIIIFVVFGIYFLSAGGNELKDLANNFTVQSNNTNFGSIFAKVARQTVGMIFLSIALSIIFVVLCNKFPKCVVYTSIIASFVVYAGLIALGIIMKIYALAIVFAVIFLINICIVYCYRQYIRIGIVLLKVSGMFMSQKPSIIGVGILSLLMSIIFEIFFIVCWIAAYSQTLQQNNSDSSSRDKFNVLIYIFYALAVFISFFLYYVMVFVVATAVAYWYYRDNQKSVCYGYGPLRYSIGSITFAAIVITIITLLRRAAQQESNNNDNPAIAIVCCLLACLLSCIQNLVNVLNHNSVIVMTVTGEGYVDSAKSALGLIWENFGLFVITDFITDFIQFYSILVCVLFPSFLGGYLIWLAQRDQNAAVIGGVMILLLSWISSSVVLGILYQTLSSIYIFYCFDKKFRREGVNANNIPNQIRQILDGASQGRDAHYQQNNDIGTQMQFRNNNQNNQNNPSPSYPQNQNQNWGPKPNYQNQNQNPPNYNNNNNNQPGYNNNNNPQNNNNNNPYYP